MAETTLTSRERVIRAINHQEPDRVPFDLTFTIDAYTKLRQYLGLPPEANLKTGIWAEVSPSLDLLDAMDLDFIVLGLNPPARPHPCARDDGLHYDEWGIGRVKVVREDGSFYYEMVKHPLAGAGLEDVKNYPWPDPYDPARAEGVREKFLQARRETDKAIVSKFTSSIWEQSSYLYGIQGWLEALVAKPDVVEAILDRTCEIAIQRAEIGLEAAGDLVDVFRLSGEDLGMQSRPIISPKMFQKFVYPRHARLIGFVKQKLAEKNPQARIMIHSCGNVRPFIPAWIEMGLDILDPIQPRADGMDPVELKREYGDRLVFHGGIDLQEILPHGTPEEVMAEVRRYIRALAPGGGYIVSAAHNVQSDVPPENLVAIRDAVRLYGRYPIH